MDGAEVAGWIGAVAGVGSLMVALWAVRRSGQAEAVAERSMKAHEEMAEALTVRRWRAEWEEHGLRLHNLVDEFVTGVQVRLPENRDLSMTLDGVQVGPHSSIAIRLTTTERTIDRILVATDQRPKAVAVELPPHPPEAGYISANDLMR